MKNLRIFRLKDRRAFQPEVPEAPSCVQVRLMLTPQPAQSLEILSACAILVRSALGQLDLNDQSDLMQEARYLLALERFCRRQGIDAISPRVQQASVEITRRLLEQLPENEPIREQNS